MLQVRSETPTNHESIPWRRRFPTWEKLSGSEFRAIIHLHPTAANWELGLGGLSAQQSVWSLYLLLIQGARWVFLPPKLGSAPSQPSHRGMLLHSQGQAELWVTGL